ncbi:ATPase [Deinococcus sp.]|uniref:ATPase n=1 Tax=Deinococcus sp. TaxID=47478 RepID=UPI003C7C7B56
MSEVSPLPGLSAVPAPGWLPLSGKSLLVLVGVTGVGKSTALAALPGLTLLPDRRELTDTVMILPLSGGPVLGREERFALTARYRQAHPGGMAEALGMLHADPALWSGGLVFDGLRGRDEVAYAAQHFPAWRFVSLHAPDHLRVRRLLGRADHFDTVSRFDTVSGVVGHGAGQDPPLSRALEELAGAAQVFTPAELDGLAALQAAGFSAAEILAKTRIVLSERRHYDPQAARAVLGTLPAARHLELDTARLSPQEVAERIRAWLPLATAGRP